MRIHKEGHKIIFNSLFLILVIVALFFIFSDSSVIRSIAAFTGILLAVLIVRFFREPVREPLNRNDVVSAPADGTIVIVKQVYEGEFLKSDCIQVSIFMSVFNVHVNWFPVKGYVEYYKYHPGKYLVAMHPKSSEKNERTTVVINNSGTRVLIRQIAGLIARRIVCYAKEGIAVSQGDQVGFIKFGSRVDIFLPLNADIQVKKGDKVAGNKTVIAKLPLSE